MWLLTFKLFLVVSSSAATMLSLVLLFSPDLFLRIEKYLAKEFGGESNFVTVLEGEIDFLNSWVFNNRVFFGPLLSILAAINTRNAFFF